MRMLLLSLCICAAAVTAAAGIAAGNDREEQQTIDVKQPEKQDDEILLLSIRSLQKYYHETQTVSASSRAAEVLAGAKAYKRSLQNERAIRYSAETASAIGASARNLILANQMAYADYDSLLHIVEAEATGGDVYSKMLIACVVLNRVKDSHFPDNVTDVVWERSEDGTAQFSPTADGRIKTVEITDTTIEAVRRVLEGEDPSQGALFFVSRERASEDNVYWFDSQLQVLYAYGGHDFFTFLDYAQE